MRVRRLGWAGVELEARGQRIVIDYVRDISPMFTGWKPGDGLLVPGGEVSAALISHLHRDHTDAAAIAEVLIPRAPVLRPRPDRADVNDHLLTQLAEGELAERELTTEVSDEWSTRDVGPFSITAIPAVDGFGDQQLSWVVEADGQRIFHGGDTLFHGYWWHIARRFPGMDAAFLPANGAVVDAPLRQPSSELEAVLDPKQAAAAARILGVRQAIPIHYDSAQPKVDYYVEVDDPAAEFCARAGARARELTVGEWLDLRSPIASIIA